MNTSAPIARSYGAATICLPLVAVLLWAVPSFGAPKKPQSPQPLPMQWSMPWAVAPGRTTEVTFFGEGLGEPIGLWTNFPANAVPITSGKRSADATGSATYRLTVPANAGVGIGAVRLLTSRGVASAQLLMIDDLPIIAQNAGNHELQDAQTIVAPVAIDGACESQSSDYYRVYVQKGQRLSVEVVAQRLGSRMDSVLRLLDEAGRELAYNDDSPGAGSDSRLVHSFEKDGPCFIEVRDVNYDGGPTRRYHLRIGDFPLIAAAFPVGGMRGSYTRFDLESIEGDQLRPGSMALPTDRDRSFLSVASASGQGSGFVPVFCDSTQGWIERESNDSPPTATRIPIPATISGRFDRSGDQDYYRFHARKGQHLIFHAATRSIGSPANLVLRLLKLDGTLLAQSAPEGADDGSVEATIPANGSYCLLVEDLGRETCAGKVYRVHAMLRRPGFSLEVGTERINVAPGEHVHMTVTATRQDYSGPITLSLGRDGSRFSVRNAVIERGKNATELDVQIPAEFRAFEPLNMTIVGKAMIGGEEVQEIASTRPALKLMFPNMTALPLELDGLIGVGIRAMKN